MTKCFRGVRFQELIHSFTWRENYSHGTITLSCNFHKTLIHGITTEFYQAIHLQDGPIGSVFSRDFTRVCLPHVLFSNQTLVHAHVVSFTLWVVCVMVAAKCHNLPLGLRKSVKWRMARMTKKKKKFIPVCSQIHDNEQCVSTHDKKQNRTIRGIHTHTRTQRQKLTGPFHISLFW